MTANTFWRTTRSLSLLWLLSCRPESKSTEIAVGDPDVVGTPAAVCAAGGTQITREMLAQSYEAQPRMTAVLVDVLQAYGLENAIVLRSNDLIDNAVSDIEKGGLRTIIYRPDFMAQPSLSWEDRDVFDRFIIAHEIGHHINGHVIAAKNRVMSDDNERRADAFAARYLRARNISRSQMERVMKAVAKALPNSSPKFPDRGNRFMEAFARAPTDIADLVQCRLELENRDQTIGGLQRETARMADLVDMSVTWGDREAAANGYGYSLRSVHMNISYDDAERSWDAPSQVRATVEISYTIHALRDLEKGFFDEEFHSDVGSKVVWKGSTEASTEVESDKDGTRTKQKLDFAMKRGEERTILTRGDYLLAWPPQGREIHDFSLSDTQDAWLYPNYADYIDELRITVESRAQLLPPQKKDALLVRMPKTVVAEGTPETRNAKEGQMFTYRWEHVGPSMRVGMRIRWKK